MNRLRKLHNSVLALTSSAAVLLVVLASTSALPQAPAGDERAIALNLGALEFTYVPNQAGASDAEHRRSLLASIERRTDAMNTDSFEGVADAAALAAEVATAAALAERIDAAAERTHSKAGTAARHSRKTLVMPYFSFAPRG